MTDPAAAPAGGVDHVGAIARHTAGLANLATGHLDAPVEHCPGWTVADLVDHLTEVQWFWATVVAERCSEPPPPQRRPPRADPAALVDRLRAAGEHLVAVLSATDPATPVWTWAPAQQDVAFVVRHQAQEAAVHHWDAGHAVGAAVTIDPAVAADAVAEFLTFSVSAEADPPDPLPPALDGRLALRCTDVPAAWTVEDGARPGTLRVTPGATAGVPAVAAPAADLLLWLYRRTRLETAEVPADLLDRFGGLTFTD